MGKSRVLVLGGTGYIGKKLVKTSLAEGHPTYVLRRSEIGLDMDKIQILLKFKEQGAVFIYDSFFDHRSLVEAVKQVDVVICAMSVVHFRSHNLLIELKLVHVIKEAGNVKEWMTPLSLEEYHSSEEKMIVRRAIEEANIPHSYVITNCFQMGTLLPPNHKLRDGNVKAVFTDENDVATYAIKSIDDPRTLNKTLYIKPPENILTQTELVDKYEKLSGKTMEKISISKQDFLALMKGADFAGQVGIGHFYHVFYEGCLTNFELGEDSEEASQLYPQVHYKRVEDYLKRYL